MTTTTKDTTKSLKPTNFLLLPLSTCLGGKTQQIDLKVSFHVDLEEMVITVTQIDGTIIVGGVESPTTHDMTYLAKTHEQLLLTLLAGNTGEWDNEKIWYSDPLNNLKSV